MTANLLVIVYIICAIAVTISPVVIIILADVAKYLLEKKTYDGLEKQFN